MAARIRIAAVQPIEAIAWARRRKVELPAEYYGHRIARARALAFSVAGMTRLDQIEHVRESLNRALEEGGTFETWKEEMLKSPEALALPRHRLDNIFRTNLQSAYMAGRCRAIQAHKASRPYLLYSAVNDSRTRPSHAAMDGTILPVDDPWWETHTPPNGFRCRCGVISISEAEARRRGISSGPPVNAQPDDGWDYSVCSHGQEEGVRRAVSRRESQCGGGASFADRKALILEDPVWCRNRRMRRALEMIQEALDKWDDPERLAREALGDRAWRKHVRKVPSDLPGSMTRAHGVVLRAYTDRDLDAWPLMNALARAIPHPGPLPFDDEGLLYRAGMLVYLMDEALGHLPASPGRYLRGVDTQGMRSRRAAFRSAHGSIGKVLVWSGYTSVMHTGADPYSGDVQFVVNAMTARDISRFSATGEPEFLMPRGVTVRISASRKDQESGFIWSEVEEVEHEQPVPRRYRFGMEQGEGRSGAQIP